MQIKYNKPDMLRFYNELQQHITALTAHCDSCLSEVYSCQTQLSNSRSRQESMQRRAMELQEEADNIDKSNKESRSPQSSKSCSSAELRHKADEMQDKAQRLSQAVTELEDTYSVPLNALSRSMMDTSGRFVQDSRECGSTIEQYMQIMDRINEELNSPVHKATSVKGIAMAESENAGNATSSGVSAGDTTPSNQSYVKGVAESLSSQKQDIMSRDSLNAAKELRAFNLPKELDSEGRRRGSWKNSDFHLQADYVPRKFNTGNLSFSQLEQQLKSKYGLDCGPVSYKNGVADFSNYSLLRLSCADIVVEASGINRFELEDMSEKERTVLYSKVFSGEGSKAAPRQSNFNLADKLAAKRHLSIPGLPENYTATQLKQWRLQNNFTWDENLIYGYSLVPSVIHGNLSHTGLVSSSGKTMEYFSNLDKLKKEHPEMLTLNDEDAPISIGEFLAKHKQN